MKHPAPAAPPDAPPADAPPADAPPAVPVRPPGRLVRRARDLALGVRFATAGGREGWTRTVLTALGVGLGVTLLLFAASVPQVIGARAEREAARTATGVLATGPVPRSDTTLVHLDISTEYQGDTVRGALLRPDGDHPPRPPGVAELPGPGEMVVSPALRELLGSPGGARLKERLGHRVVGTIGDRGLSDPAELALYAGSDTLTPARGGNRTAGYGHPSFTEPLDPALVVLVTLVCVVLLVPVTVFIATAVRFGGERRDRRLAALRLVGADIGTTRWIAAGEALFGAVLGLLTGGALFLALRPIAGGIQVWNLSAFPADLVPVPAVAALIVVAVPALAVAVTLVALRAVTIEPLGVVRDGAPRGRRFGWRLLCLAAGLALLLGIRAVGERARPPGDAPYVDPYPVAAGAALLLVGLTTLLPWLVEAAVARLRGGPVSWQLAVRALQFSGGAATRAVSGITVAVAGAIALQMLFAGVQQEFRTAREDAAGPRLRVEAPYGDPALAARLTDRLGALPGVGTVLATTETYAVRPGPVAEGAIQPTTSLTVASCAALRGLAALPSCRDGDTFVAHIPGNEEQNDWTDETARPGRPVDLSALSGDDGAKPLLWTLPASARTVRALPGPHGAPDTGILATPAAVRPELLTDGWTIAILRMTDRSPAAEERVRDAAARVDLSLQVSGGRVVEREKAFDSVRRGLLVAGTATLAVIALSMLVAQIEQLRERRHLLSVLTAFGTRRSTLARSVLWQAAVPVAIGTVLAAVGGLALGVLMLKLLGKPYTDWWTPLPFAGAGAGIVLLVTGATLPALWRFTRPEAPRDE
ncbi:FtsX-like permease family protein [Streptomyces sp. NPDC088124]|uniref:FtsX-like permease family protein n=1 Tax=Streptomyces sp. NPDC088124 TaxID=3154654 RepID=UPI0034418F02